MQLRAVVKRMIWLAMKVPLLGRAVIAYYKRRPPEYLSGWNREHPFDSSFGVQTSGAIPSFVLGPGTSIGHGAAQPSIIRTALTLIPNRQYCHFVDIGCGKGRPLFVATEFDFRAITGVEFSPALSHIARENVAAFSRAYPDRTRINIVSGDALAYELPEEKLVMFLYNPFDRPIVAHFLSNIETTLRATPRDLYIIYYNPVWAEVLDASASLERRYAAQLPYDPSEIGYGPQESDAVVIWQNRGNSHPRVPGDPAAPVSIVAPGLLVEITTRT